MGPKAMKTAKPAMKAAMKAMKAAKAMVLKGTREKTAGGLTAKDIIRNRYGKFVSKNRSALMKNHPWMKACAAARKALAIKGFVALNRGLEGKALYVKAKAIYNA